MVELAYTRHHLTAINAIIIGSCGVSIILSVLLFHSMANGWMAFLFGTVAFVMEIMKFLCIPAIKIHRDAGEKAFPGILGFTWLVLVVISIMGSIGGLQSGLQTHVADVNQYEEERVSVQKQIDDIERSIQQKSATIATNTALIDIEMKSAELYQKEKKLTLGSNKSVASAKSLMRTNTSLSNDIEQMNKDKKALYEQLTEIIPPEASGAVALAKNISTITGYAPDLVQSWLYVFVSVFLDISAAIALWMREKAISHSRRAGKDKDGQGREEGVIDGLIEYKPEIPATPEGIRTEREETFSETYLSFRRDIIAISDAAGSKPTARTIVKNLGVNAQIAEQLANEAKRDPEVTQ